jgi:recombination protein RecR
MSFSPLVNELIEALRRLPGVGPKTAQRLALHLLQRDRDGARRLATALEAAAAQVGHCSACRTLTEEPVCTLCRNPQRDRSQLCVVEWPQDMLSLENSGAYRGLYFILMGRLSPLDGIGPGELGLDRLEVRLDAGEVREVIVATSSTVEGETTAHVIGEMCRSRGIPATRLAQGVPLGGELEFVDGGTLAQALQGRRPLV